MSDSTSAFLEFDINVRLNGFELDAKGIFDNGITAIFGPSGAGKSTLLSCLAGLRRPDRGKINMGGKALYSSARGIRIRPQLYRSALVFQDGALFPHMTVRRNIEYGFRLTPKNQRFIDPSELTEFLGIDHLADRLPASLSGGEKQRVALARSLAMSPRILLLDEPVASLDVRLRHDVVGYLKRTHERYEMPMIYVSHSLSDVLALADMALVLDHGKVRTFGNASEVILDLASSLGGRSEGIDNLHNGIVEADDVIRLGETRIIVPSLARRKGADVTISIAAAEIILATQRPEGISARNVLPGNVVRIIRGEFAVFAVVDTGSEFVVELTSDSAIEMGLEVGKEVYAIFKTSSITVTDQ